MLSKPNIPFKLTDNAHTILKVKVNDDDITKNFIFDSGAISTVIDSSSANELGLKPDFNQKVQGAGGEKSYDVILGQNLKIDDKIVIKDIPLIVSNLSAISNSVGLRIDGIIGYSILKKYIVKLDYINKKLTLAKSIDAFNLNVYSKVPFRFDNGVAIPQIEISTILNNKTSISGRILFDSGAGTTLIVNKPFNLKHKLIEKSDKYLLKITNNLHKESALKSIKIDSMNLANFDLGEMVIHISNDSEGVSSWDGYFGLLGAKVISRFDVVFDYFKKNLYLKSNKNYIEPFKFPVSGIQLINKKNNVIIAYVNKKSEAYSKGLRKGDKIISINKNDSNNLGAYRQLLSEKGSKAVIFAVDGKERKRKKVSIELKRLL